MAAKANKTQPTSVSVEEFLASAPRSADALALCALMARVSGEQPRMWGAAIVGFGVRHYKYESGREGEILKVGFASRKPALVLYGLGASEHAEEIAALGKVTTDKGCVYLKSLAEIDTAKLEALIRRALQA